MQERPYPIQRLDSVFRASLMAHEAIFDLHRELISIGRDNPETAELLEESARLTLRELPRAAARAQRLVAAWEEQNILDPGAAEGTLRELVVEFQRIEPQLQGVIDRHQQIAARLRQMLDA